ncbi:hypothetical protein VIGAN_03133700 [Vigna angularis var. angularis]|uniref:Uncharacterized protein n=1 Tax=Vigna angularis var. angularis TaxID=157739 RepID=A0A0S3RLV5_PHAAN|nr:hypothetical protein VIGAN_03133700 [Vigna angularis var. angularis]
MYVPKVKKVGASILHLSLSSTRTVAASSIQLGRECLFILITLHLQVCWKTVASNPFISSNGWTNSYGSFTFFQGRVLLPLFAGFNIA